MSILDTFTILFKADDSGLKKGLKESDKALDDFTKKQKEVEQNNRNLGASFLDLTTAGVAAFGAIFAVGKIKAGITDAIDYNAAIERTAILGGESAKTIAALAGAAAASGGSAEGATAQWKQFADEIIKTGTGDTKNILLNYLEWSKQMKALTDAGDRQGARRVGLLHGVTDEGTLLLLEKGPEAVKAMLDESERLNAVSEDGYKKFLEFEGALNKIGQNARGIFSSWGPEIDYLVKAINTLVYGIRGIGIALNEVLSGNFSHLANAALKSLFGTSPEEARAKLEGHGTAYPSNPDDQLGIRNNNPGNLRKWGDAQVVGGFAQFATREEGLEAEQKQLKLYGSRGINTLSSIASTWAPNSENDTAAYIAGLSKSTGYDPNKKLDLNDPAVLARVANAINKNENGAAYGNMITTAQGAINAADNSSFNAAPAPQPPQGGGGVHVENMTIHTQATDAPGISRAIKESLSKEYSYANGNNASSITH